MTDEKRRLIRRQFGGGGLPDFVHRISPYRAMWLIVCFDLPVGSRSERRAATRFRKDLLNEGFQMKQWSVYQRYFPSRAQAEAAADRLGKQVPKLGDVSVLFLTDKQFGQTRNYQGAAPKDTEKPPDQLVLL